VRGVVDSKFDVIVLGAGFGGSILASILARQGVSVLVLDAKSHPRFSIGESTIPQTSQLLTLLGRTYDVPELNDLGLGSPKGLRKQIGNSCGIKRTFGFCYHELGKEHDPDQALQFGNVWRDENHLFRQDVDAFLARTAVSYGATMMQDTPTASIDIREEEGVTVTTQKGQQFTAQFVVDGSGRSSVLADRFALREDPPRFLHHSRSLFTHMIDVAPFEEVVENKRSIPWSKSTLHHVFERGWIWVIPFNNFEESTNPLVSVGLTIDPRTYPKSDIPPEQEFEDFLKLLPSAARQFADAKPVRPWVSTGRIQYSSRVHAGPRFCLMSHAAGFIDPLFSRGLVNTVEVVAALADDLISAAETGDYSQERFDHINDLQISTLDYADRLVNGSFISWSNFEVWNAWLRLWVVGTGVAESNLGGHLLMGRHSKRPMTENPIFSPFEDPGYRPVFEKAEAIILAFELGRYSAEQASRELWEILTAYDFRMPLRAELSGQEWAVMNRTSRDLQMGTKQLHERWSRRQADPGLA